MTDPEDAIILEDIKALEAVLVKKEVIKRVEPTSENTTPTPTTSTSTPADYQFVDVTDLRTYVPSDEERDGDLEDASDSEADSDCESNDKSDEQSSRARALRLNAKLEKLLLVAKRKLTFLLAECRKKQQEIDQKINRQGELGVTTRTILSTAGMPYFKDKKFFAAPRNEDVKTKCARDEFQLVHLPHCYRWLRKDRETIVRVIYWSARYELENKKEKALNKAAFGDVSAEVPYVETSLPNKPLTPAMLGDLRQLVGPLGSREFDWFKISVRYFNSRHSPSECRAMWNVFLHPDINKKKWDKSEDAKLKELANKKNFQNWQAIANELETGRTGYQCFVRCNNARLQSRCENQMWTPEEDRHLISVIGHLRIGDWVPWSQVANQMNSRTKTQVYLRYTYSLAPQLKKGRFSPEEDKLLLEAVSMYGNNFSKISTCLFPARSSVQLNDHYKTLMWRAQEKWKKNEDQMLMQLYKKHGNQWAEIAKAFPNKNRVQVRHRYNALVRYGQRGISIKDIPRPHEVKLLNDRKTHFHQTKSRLNAMANSMMVRECSNSKKISPADKALRDYCRSIYHVRGKPGRTKRIYTKSELDQKTRKLHVLLQILNADVHIPENLDEDKRSINLNEMERQLINSYRDYARDVSTPSTEREVIENLRQQMFGANESKDEYFVPPIPFSLASVKSKRYSGAGIDYRATKQLPTIQPAADISLTSSEIISLIGGQEREMLYQRMKKLFLGKISEPTKPSLVEENRSASKSSARPTESGAESRDQSDLPSNGEPHTVLHRKIIQSRVENIVIPPNFVTLLGFRGILLAKHMLEATDDPFEESDDEEEIHPEHARASELFVERLVKLFKLPIEMSEIPPPACLDTNEYDQVDEVVNDAAVVGIKRRKPMKEKHSKAKVAKLSENGLSDNAEAGPSWA